MRSRRITSPEQNVPLPLWISTAILAHIASGGGAEQIARVIEDRSELQYFARSIQQRLRPPEAIEVAFENISEKASEPAELPMDNSAEPRSPDAPKPEKKKKNEPKKATEPKKVEKKIILPQMVAAPSPPEHQEPPQIDHRIAVKQHADADQEDNPTARFIADEANHVKEESVAQFTAHDQDDPSPTPGGSHAGPQGRPGNSDHEKIGDSDEHPGDPTHAPGESARTPETEHSQKSASTRGQNDKSPLRGV